MDKELTFELDYKHDEVISAQRMRGLESSRWKFLLIISVVCTVGLIARRLYFWYNQGAIPADWFNQIGVAVVFILVPLLVYFFVPLLDFWLNPIWRRKLDLNLQADKLRVTARGKSEGLELQWSRVNKVLENKKAFVVFAGSENAFLILPKRVFKENESDFREMLKQKASPLWKSKE